MRPVADVPALGGLAQLVGEGVQGVELDVDAAAVAEHPEEVQAVVVGGEHALAVAGLLAQRDQLIRRGDAQALGELVGPLDGDPPALERDAQDLPVADPTCDRDRLIGGGEAAVAQRVVAAGCGQAREQRRALAAVVRADSGQRAFEHRHIGRIDAGPLPPEAPAVGQRRARELVGPSRRLGQVGRAPQRRARRGAVAGAAERVAEREQQLARLLGVVRARLLAQRECAAVVLGRLLVAVLRGGTVAGAAGVVDRLRRERGAGLAGVARQLGQVGAGVAGVEVLERLGHRAVQAQPPRRGEVLVERVADKDVGEAQPPARLGHGADEPGLGRLVEGREHLVLVPPGDGADDVGVELAADHGGQCEQLAAGVGLALQAPADRLDHAARDGEPVRRRPALGRQQPSDLAREQRVALGLRVDLGGQVGGGRVAHRQRQQERGVGSAEAAQRERRGGRRAGDVGQGCGQLGADLGVAIAADHEQGRAAELRGDEAQEQQRGCVCGVQVVEADDERARGAGVAQEGRDRLEEPEAVGLGRLVDQVGQFGQERRELGPLASELVAERVGVDIAHVGAQRLHPRPVRRRAAGLPAAPDADARPAGPRMVRELVGQAALADPGLAGDEHEPPATGDRVVERAEQHAELALAADESAGRGGRRRRGRVELGVLTQDRLLELAQLAAGLDPELVDERAARVLVGAERLGLAPRAVQRAHELAAQALAQRVLGDQRLELGHDVAAPEREVGLDAIRGRLQAQLLEPLGRAPVRTGRARGRPGPGRATAPGRRGTPPLPWRACPRPARRCPRRHGAGSGRGRARRARPAAGSRARG